jgi:hypothetical protein
MANVFTLGVGAGHPGSHCSRRGCNGVVDCSRCDQNSNSLLTQGLGVGSDFYSHSSGVGFSPFSQMQKLNFVKARNITYSVPKQTMKQPRSYPGVL